MSRAICEIVQEVKAKDVPFAARPYLAIMRTLTRIDEMFMADSARTIVLYFLSNCGTWRGDMARKVKYELRQLALR